MKAPMKALAAAAILFALMAVSAHGQTQRSGDQNARVMQQLQQLSTERSQLKSENEKLKLELDAVKKELASATSLQSALQQRMRAAESTAARDAADNTQNSEALEKLRAQTQELIARFRETAQSLRDVEVDRNQAKRDLAARDRELSICVDRNRELYELGVEVVDRLENKGVFSSLAEKEPFTRIQRTRLENLIEGYKERADDSRIDEQPSK